MASPPRARPPGTTSGRHIQPVYYPPFWHAAPTRPAPHVRATPWRRSTSCLAARRGHLLPMARAGGTRPVISNSRRSDICLPSPEPPPTIATVLPAPLRARAGGSSSVALAYPLRVRDAPGPLQEPATSPRSSSAGVSRRRRGCIPSTVSDCRLSRIAHVGGPSVQAGRGR